MANKTLTALTLSLALAGPAAASLPLPSKPHLEYDVHLQDPWVSSFENMQRSAFIVSLAFGQQRGVPEDGHVLMLDSRELLGGVYGFMPCAKVSHYRHEQDQCLLYAIKPNHPPGLSTEFIFSSMGDLLELHLPFATQNGVEFVVTTPKRIGPFIERMPAEVRDNLIKTLGIYEHALDSIAIKANTQ